MTANGFNSDGEYIGSAVAVDGAPFVNVANIRTAGRVGYMLIDGIVGAGGDLSSIQIDSCASAGDPHQVWATDAGITTASFAIPRATTAIPVITAGLRFQMLVFVDGCAEIGINVKGTTTTCQIKAHAPRQAQA